MVPATRYLQNKFQAVQWVIPAQLSACMEQAIINVCKTNGDHKLC